jgi:hemoglobin
MYARIGGHDGIDRLVDDFYHIMASDPIARECYLTHEGRDLKESGEKLKAFLSGWTGGPQLYLEKYGHPRLRMRHFPFKIGPLEGEQWLYCMQKALEKSSIEAGAQSELMMALSQVVKMLSEYRP